MIERDEGDSIKRSALVTVLAIAAGAFVLAIVLAIGNRLGDDSGEPSASEIPAEAVDEMLKGIPQKGIELGDPKAKLTLVEFADPQCAYCGEWARDVFPALVNRYVRSGKLRLEYAGLAVMDDYRGAPGDSDRLLRLAYAAGLQNKLWNVVTLEYENQGSENSGYVTDSFIEAIVEAVPDLDSEEVLALWDTDAVVPMIDAANRRADRTIARSKIPVFLLEPTGAEPTQVFTETADRQSLFKAIDAELKK